jgi:hypothetical protein
LSEEVDRFESLFYPFLNIHHKQLLPIPNKSVPILKLEF